MRQILALPLLLAVLALGACSTFDETRKSLDDFWNGPVEETALREADGSVKPPEFSDLQTDETMMASMQDAQQVRDELEQVRTQMMGDDGQDPAYDSQMNVPRLQALRPQPLPESGLPLQTMAQAPRYAPGVPSGIGAVNAPIAQALGYMPPSVAGYAGGMPMQSVNLSPASAQPMVMPSPYSQEMQGFMQSNPSVQFNSLPQLGIYAGTQMMPPSGYSSQNGAMPMAYGTPGAVEASLFFGHGSAQLSAVDRQNLAALAAKARETVSPIRVVAYASRRAEVSDPLARRLLNLEMSVKRAEVVAKELAKGGVPANKIKVTAHGDSYAEMPTDSGEAQDRRVELLFDVR